MIEKEIYLDDLQELKTFDFVKETTAEDIFGNLDNINQLAIEKFNNIYLLDINPQDIDKYKDYKDIHKIIKRAIDRNASEYRNIQLMIFQINQEGIDKMEELYIKMKPIYGDNLVRNKNKYYMIIGYFGGTQGRTNQYVINEIKEKFNIKNIAIQ